MEAAIIGLLGMLNATILGVGWKMNKARNGSHESEQERIQLLRDIRNDLSNNFRELSHTVGDTYDLALSAKQTLGILQDRGERRD